jgi:hypothetical protein
MTNTLDIFRQDVGQPIWVGSASSVEDAKRRIRELVRTVPGDYFVFDVASGQKKYETNSNQQSFCVTSQPFGKENRAV